MKPIQPETIRLIDRMARDYDYLDDVPRRDLLQYASAYHREHDTAEMFADSSGIRCLHELMRLIDEADDYWECGRVFADHMIATSNIREAFQLAKVYLPDPDEEVDTLPIG